MSDLSAIDVAVSPVEKFAEYLSTKGKRLTQERRTVVEEVFSSHEHFDADELVARLRPRVSRPTVYRHLADMEAAGLLRKVARPNRSDVYEHDYGYPQHDHMLCKKCGDLIEFPNEQIADMLEEIATQHGFRMPGHRLVVYGTCDKCSRAPQRRHRKLDMV